MKGRPDMPSDHAPDFSVVIINYNGAAYLAVCLGGLDQQTMPQERYETILLDNASADRSLELVRSAFPRVHLLPQSRNTGFAEGNNIAVGAARGKFIVLLNNDTIPDPFWLEELERAIAENPGCVVGSKLVMAGEPDRINSAGLCLLRDGRGADRSYGERDVGQCEAGGEVFAACAAAVAIPRAFLREPLFDPTYFLYCEDLEEGWAGRLAGRRTVLAPRAVVRHFVGASGGDRSPIFWYHLERNRALTALRHGNAFLMVLSCGGLVLRALRSLVMAWLRHPAPKYRWPAVTAIWQALGSVLMRAPFLLSERWNAPRRGPS